VPSYVDLWESWQTSKLALWGLVFFRLVPYAAAAYLVPRLGGTGGSGDAPGEPGRRVGPVLSLSGRGWAEVRPVILTLVPWSVVLFLAINFPAVSRPVSLWATLQNYLSAGGYIFLTSLMTFPFFLGVVGPTLGGLLVGLLGLAPSGQGGRVTRGGWTAAHVVHALAGAAVLLVWMFLPRPALANGLVGSSQLFLYYGPLYFVAACIQGTSRNVLWPVLGYTINWLSLGVIPKLLALFFRW